MSYAETEPQVAGEAANAAVVVDDPSLPTSASNKTLVDSTDDNLYVLTENEEQCIVWRANQLTYIAQDREEIPSVLATKFGNLATKLDLSFNSLTSFKYINLFENLSELILDNNSLSDDQMDFRQNLRLKTLSLNKNKLVDLYRLISSIKACFPNLEYLSLIGNPLWPDSCVVPTNDEVAPASRGTNQLLSFKNLTIEELVISEQSLLAEPLSQAIELGHTASSSDYQRYRHFVIYHLPNLRFLDSKPISGSERDEALRRCFWMTSINKQNDSQSNGRTASRVVNREPLVQSSEPDDYQACDLQTRRREVRPVGGQQEFRLEIISTIPPASDDAQLSELQPASHSKGVFSKLVYKYTGKNSEGNRFIRNQDL